VEILEHEIIPDNDDWKDYMDDKEDENLDYETIPLTKEYKLKFLEGIIRQGVERKYKISLFKGV
jgi:hypothetical protein